jgi:hypothetical protein
MCSGGKVIADHNILLQRDTDRFFNVSTAECTETEILDTDEAITSLGILFFFFFQSVI